MKSRKMLVIAPIVALTLAVGGTAFASGGWGGPHDGAHGYGPHGSLRWGFGRDAAPLGMVTSLVGTTLTVLDFDGTTITFTVGGQTKYFLNGQSVTSIAVTAGENVIVIAPHDWGGSSGPTASPMANVVFLVSPHAFGSIQSQSTNVTGDAIVVADPQGFWHTIQTSSMTVYYVNGVSSTTAPTFTTGEIIAALGSVGSDHSTLDATQVNVVTLHAHHHH
jgi:hypothetical protein